MRADIGSCESGNATSLDYIGERLGFRENVALRPKFGTGRLEVESSYAEWDQCVWY